MKQVPGTVVYYTCFNKRLMQLINTKSKQKIARKKCRLLYLSVTIYLDLPVFTYPNQI